MSADLVVIGLGYVGLPLAEAATDSGLRVAGLDVNSSVVGQLVGGHSHINDVSDAQVQTMLELGFEPTADETILSSAKTIVICVPTPLAHGGGPDLTAVKSALHSVARHLQPGQLVVLESTTYPGTTDEIARPLLEATGLVVGQDVHLAFSPERVDPGNPSFGIRNTPKIVGGCTPLCTEAAMAFYSHFVDVVVAAQGTREAEMSKLLENTYRHVNIALVNELARFCHDLNIDVWDVIRLASTKPFGYQAFYPGPGVGGHCIPIDPHYLAYKVRSDLGQASKFIDLAQQINASMPEYVVTRCGELLTANSQSIAESRILLLGVTYKRDIADTRETPAAELARLFSAGGATVTFHDPYIEKWTVTGMGTLTSVRELDAALAACDLAVLVQEHSAYDLAGLAAAAPLVFDTRGHIPAGQTVERL